MARVAFSVCVLDASEWSSSLCVFALGLNEVASLMECLCPKHFFCLSLLFSKELYRKFIPFLFFYLIFNVFFPITI